MLNGSKTWITNAPIADVFVVWAKDDAGDIRGFLLEKGMPGLSRAEDRGQVLAARLGHRHDHDAGRVRARGAMLPDVKGLRGPVLLPEQCALRHRLGRAGRGGVLLARGARLHAASAIMFGRPLAATQLVQKKLADMQTEITLGLQAVLRLGRLIDEGRAAPEMISLLKRNNCGKALDIARTARDMHGGNGDRPTSTT